MVEHQHAQLMGLLPYRKHDQTAHATPTLPPSSQFERHGEGAAAHADQVRAPEAAITLAPLDTSLDPDMMLLGAGFGGALSAQSQGSSRRRSLSQGSASLVSVDDVSELWGGSQSNHMAWDAPDAVFGDGSAGPGEEIDRRFSLELEKLRSAAIPEAARHSAADVLGPLDPGAVLPVGKGADADVPEYGDGWGEPGSLPTPESGALAPLPGASPFPLPGTTPGAGRASDILPAASGERVSQAAGQSQGASQATPPSAADRPAPRRRAAHQLARRTRKPTIDRAADGKPQTEIPSMWRSAINGCGVWGQWYLIVGAELNTLS